MSAWTKLDELRARVAKAPAIEVPSGSTEDALIALRRSGFSPDRLVTMGWEVLLSRRKQDSIVLWHFSAKLHPRGRSSTDNDWNVLRRIAARVGAPRDPVLMPEDPNAAIHWSWIEGHNHP